MALLDFGGAPLDVVELEEELELLELLELELELLEEPPVLRLKSSKYAATFVPVVQMLPICTVVEEPVFTVKVNKVQFVEVI